MGMVLAAQLGWAAATLCRRSPSCPSWSPLPPRLSGLLTKCRPPSSSCTPTQVSLLPIGLPFAPALLSFHLEAVALWLLPFGLVTRRVRGLFVRALLTCCVAPSALESELGRCHLCLMAKIYTGVSHCEPLLSLNSSSVMHNSDQSIFLHIPGTADIECLQKMH